MRRFCSIWVGALMAVLLLPKHLVAESESEESILRSLNARNVRAFVECDVEFYKTLLTDDFEAVLADGRMIDRSEFLREAATPPGVHGLQLNDVVCRVHGDSAVVTAWVAYKRSDETLARTRYTDLYVKIGRQWRLASVQWTRILPMAKKP